MAFLLDADNNITAIGGAKPAVLKDQTIFASQKELAKLAAGWGGQRLIDIWNSFAGAPPFGELKPVKKFTDRKAAVTRIWNAIQVLAGAAKAAEPVEGKETPAKGTRRAGGAGKPVTAKAAKAKDSEAKAPREGTKQAQVIALMRRPDGVTLAGLMQQMGWQAHTVRGFMAGAIGKKLGLRYESFKNAAGERAYRLPAVSGAKG